MTLASPPILDALIGGENRTDEISRPWLEWLNSITDRVEKCPYVVVYLDLHSQSAAITATDITDGAIASGHYRLSYSHRIETAAGGSSATQLTITWVQEGVTQTWTGTNLTGNTTTTRESGTQIFHVDANSAITYAATYTSVPSGGADMTFELLLGLERIPE